MGQDSKIEWTHHTFNPWRGCEHATLADGSPHPGCAHCYAETMSGRNPAALGRWGSAAEGGVRVMGSAAYWRQPLKWNREAAAAGERRRVFCASLADVFEDWQGPILDAKGEELWLTEHSGPTPLNPTEVECFQHLQMQKLGWRRLSLDHLRRELFALIDATPHLDWLLLTKRPQNIRRMWAHRYRRRDINGAGAEILHHALPRHLDNVWLLTSVSDQATADALIPELLACRDLVPVLGISAEPLLGPMNLNELLLGHCKCGKDEGVWGEKCTRCGRKGDRVTPLVKVSPDEDYHRAALDWVIVGGESGHGARPMHPQWARDIRDQCAAANVAFLLKQWGEWAPGYSQGHAHVSFCDDHTEQSDGDECDNCECMAKVGKKAAGRELDGVLHDAFPLSIGGPHGQGQNQD